MKILALETTEKYGSVALLNLNSPKQSVTQPPDILAEIILPKDQRSSQTLHPAMYSLFETTQTDPTDVEIVAVVAGPGSFTGLRVGITAAKVFAYTAGARVIALDTFLTVASAAFRDKVPGSLLSVGVDAQRKEVVAAVLRQAEGGRVEFVREPELIAVADWWTLAEQYHDMLFSGPALERWGDKSPPHVVFAPESGWFPKASVAGQLAAERMVSGQFDDVWGLLPIYSRPSAAEEKRQQSQKRWA